jgi:peptidyl-prolyl cis-trans isomerase B (cyclophilin B)
MLRSVVTILAVLAAAPWAPPAVAQQADPVTLDWTGAIYRIGGPMKIRIATRDEKRSATLSASNLVVTTAEKKELRVVASAGGTKPKIEQGAWFIEVDGGQLSEPATPGRFEVTYQLEDGHRCKPLVGRFVKPIDHPVDALEKSPKPGEYSRVAVLFETDLGPMLVGLRPDKAPATVANFVKLTARGFYDDKVFHRIRRGFVAQAGGYKKDGTREESERIQGEFSDLTHERGTLSMARLGNDKDSANCQFFICFTDQKRTLDHQYASFGRVIEGMDALDRIALVPVDFNPELNEKSKPEKPPVILKATCVERPGP